MDIIATSESTWQGSAGSVVVADYNDGLNDGLEAGSLAADAILDGTAFADGTYTNNTLKSLRSYIFRATGLKKLYCTELEEIQATMFGTDTNTLEYVYLPKLKKLGGQALAFNSRITGDWSFLGRVETMLFQALRQCTLPESITFSNLTVLDGFSGSPFGGVPTTKHLRFPKLQVLSKNTISSNTSVQTAEFGSVGYPVTSVHATAFNNNAYISSITIYCEDPNNPPTGSPWGASNATVTFLKA